MEAKHDPTPPAGYRLLRLDEPEMDRVLRKDDMTYNGITASWSPEWFPGQTYDGSNCRNARARRITTAPQPTEPKPTGREYRISNVADFLCVPADRMTECLASFADMLADMRRLATAAGYASGDVPVDENGNPWLYEYVFVDDGKRGGVVTTAPAVESQEGGVP
jgi:hypothetical protein